MRQHWIREARKCARSLLRRFGVTAANHILIESFAHELGAEIVVGQLRGASAQLVRNGDRVQIVIPAKGVEIGALRFAIAHELGHFVLGHPSCSPEELLVPTRRSDREDQRDHEAEANAFAGELLMPRELVMPHLAGCSMTLVPVFVVGALFEVSILAASRRIAQVTRQPCAAVFSTAGKITWVETSPTFTSSIARGQPVASGSIASQFFAGAPMVVVPRSVPSHAWGAEPGVGTDIVEHATASPHFGTVLSMLHVRRSRTARQRV